jgi:hypothetical protein
MMATSLGARAIVAAMLLALVSQCDRASAADEQYERCVQARWATEECKQRDARLLEMLRKADEHKRKREESAKRAAESAERYRFLRQQTLEARRRLGMPLTPPRPAPAAPAQPDARAKMAKRLDHLQRREQLPDPAHGPKYFAHEFNAAEYHVQKMRRLCEAAKAQNYPRRVQAQYCGKDI